ncbi:alkaline phosphatase D family protein [Mycolicibacterium arseniciresistens]|uniref:Alkaline phosphatase D family protein n=1 Tax=Mycolicibacterium arseniciresistens TaxID=3062257 RepID=A0ABT8UQF8_9MYCO|nr:alkaline phosphatase D family protein [Mycolicibacterium arseniciresistens]MDO3640037.1 alkaline phosphatase D family protein [Mycolicibacterium arseniciresistens]
MLRAALLVPAGAALAGGALTSCGSAATSTPGLVRARPRLTHGVASGDPRPDGALLWARSDTPATMIVETASSEEFTNPVLVRGPLLTPDSDGTGRIRLTGLEPGQQVHYRVTLEGDDGARGEPLTGVFTTAPAAPADIRFLWSGDVAGQGWGINADTGGMTVWRVMADRRPDFFIHSGDAIYADNPITATQKQNNGKIYRNVTAPAKDQVAQTLDQFRGNYQYNLTDANYRYFNAAVPQLVQWDDHEVINNWYPGEDLGGQSRKGYARPDLDALAGFGHQAWREWQPIDVSESVDGRVHRRIAYGHLLDVFMLDMRSYKNPNPDAWATGGGAGVLGAAQSQWLIDSLRASKATWKVVANDLPLGIVVPDAASDPPSGPKSIEGVAQGDPGRPLGREAEIARILTATRDVPNVVYLTADVHCTAAISYHPDRAAFTDFSPFYEFVSGPLNAGAFPASPLDGTFGAAYEFVHAPTEENTSPAEGFQHFGEVTIDKDSRALTVNLCDSTGAVLWSKVLPAA